MMKYVVCGTSVEDVEAGVKAMKMAIANGATCGVGGDTMAEVEKGIDAMKQMVRGNIPTIKDCLHPSCDCPCPCCDCEDEDDPEWDCDCEDEDEEADPDYEDGYRAYVKMANGLYEPNEKSYSSQNEALISLLESGYPLETIQIEWCRCYDDGFIYSIDVEKPATDTWFESH